MYHCRQSFCVPYRMVCDGRRDCPSGDDELGCEHFTCPGGLRRFSAFQSHAAGESVLCDPTCNVMRSSGDTLQQFHCWWLWWMMIMTTLQYFCQWLPMSYRIDQRPLLFWQKMMISYNVVLFTLSRLILNQFVSVGSRYGITLFSISPRTVQLQIWNSFACLWRSPLRMHVHSSS